MSNNQAIDENVIDQPPQTDRELALRLEIEAIRARYRNYLYYGLFGVFLLGLIITYGIDVHNDSKTDIENNYKEIEKLITSAYRADPEAHAEVVRRFPVLLKGRLPKKLKRLQAEPIVEQSITDNPNLKSVSVAQDPGALISRRPPLKIYSDRSEDSILIGSVNDIRGISLKDRRGDWTSVSLTTGLPAWISSVYVEELKPSEIRVSASRVGLRIQPDSSREFIIGIVDTDDTLKVISKRDDWYQVRTPTELEVWARTEDMDQFVGLVPASENVSMMTPLSGASTELISEASIDRVDTETATDLPQPELVANRSEQAVPVDPSPLPEPLVVGRAQQPVPVDPLPIAEPLPPPAGPEREPEPVSEPAEEMQLASAIVPTQTSTPRAKLKLYQDRDESSILLGSIRDDSEIIAIIRRGDWSTIMLSTGIPVWLPAANATELSTSLVKVSSDDVGLRIRPELSREFIVTTVGSGDTLQVLEKSGSWYRVNTPADYEAWVKTDELNRLLE